MPGESPISPPETPEIVVVPIFVILVVASTANFEVVPRIGVEAAKLEITGER